MPEYNPDDIDLSEYLELDTEIEDAGEVNGIPIFRDGNGNWIAAPGYEDELELFLLEVFA